MKNFVLPTLNVAWSFLIQVIDFLLKSVVVLTKNLEKTFIFTTCINISLFIKYLELQDNRKKPVSIKNFWLVFRVKWFRYYFPLKITRRCSFLILKNFLGSSLSIWCSEISSSYGKLFWDKDVWYPWVALEVESKRISGIY